MAVGTVRETSSSTWLIKARSVMVASVRVAGVVRPQAHPKPHAQKAAITAKQARLNVNND